MRSCLVQGSGKRLQRTSAKISRTGTRHWGPEWWHQRTPESSSVIAGRRWRRGRCSKSSLWPQGPKSNIPSRNKRIRSRRNKEAAKVTPLKEISGLNLEFSDARSVVEGKRSQLQQILDHCRGLNAELGRLNADLAQFTQSQTDPLSRFGGEAMKRVCQAIDRNKVSSKFPL